MTEDVLGMDEAMRLLRKEVANKGADYVYENPVVDGEQVCLYFHNGAPSCVVGHVLADRGYGEEFFAGSTDTGSRRNCSTVTGLALDQNSVLDEKAALVLRYAQCIQDSGGTWGEALERAEQEYREQGGTE